jgi:hypothetical protein
MLAGQDTGNLRMPTCAKRSYAATDNWSSTRGEHPMKSILSFLERYSLLMDLNHKVIASWVSIAIAIFVGYFAYSYYDRHVKLQENNARLERTLRILQGTREDNDQRLAMFDLFPGRWTVPLGTPLTTEEAIDFREKCTKPRDHADLCKKWDVARKHLNEIEPVAFAYVHNLGDSKIIAASTCVYMSRSFKYFERLIEAFRALYGNGHSWQAIAHAVTNMKNEYGDECTKLTGLKPNQPPSQ